MLLAYSFLFLVVLISALIFYEGKRKISFKKEFENNHILDYTIFFAVRQVESANFLAKIITLLKNCHFDGNACCEKGEKGIFTK